MVCSAAVERDDGRILVVVMSTATGHFIAQRVSAIILLFLGLWFAASLFTLNSFDHAVVFAFVAQPLHSILLALMSAIMAYHSYLGVEVIIDDYVHSTALNSIALLGSRAAHLFLGLTSLYAIYSIGFAA